MQGKIIKGIAGFYYVQTKTGVYECKAKGSFRNRKLKPYVGDNVEDILKKLYFTNGNTFGNKLYTLEALASNKEFIPDNFILPEFLVAINKKIEAFNKSGLFSLKIKFF